MLHYRLHSDPKSSHQQIASLAREFKKSPILDVGAAQGFFGQLLQDNELVIDGVEPVQEWAERARPYYRNLINSTIEDADLPKNTYQLVICGDVLEHLPDPVKVLKRLQSCSTDDAVFVISLPNVAHLAVRLMLMFGFFPKMERGILDRTHLQFYTRKTAKDMLVNTGLRVTRISPTGIPLDEVIKDPRLKPLLPILIKLQHIALRSAPNLFAFQWVFTARKANATVPESR